MLLSNQLAEFLSHQYLWKECMDNLDFMHGDIHQLKVASETSTSGWVFPGIPSQSQTYLELPRVPLDGPWALPE